MLAGLAISRLYLIANNKRQGGLRPPSSSRGTRWASGSSWAPFVDAGASYAPPTPFQDERLPGLSRYLRSRRNYSRAKPNGINHAYSAYRVESTISASDCRLAEIEPKSPSRRDRREHPGGELRLEGTWRRVFLRGHLRQAEPGVVRYTELTQSNCRP